MVDQPRDDERQAHELMSHDELCFMRPMAYQLLKGHKARLGHVNVVTILRIVFIAIGPEPEVLIEPTLEAIDSILIHAAAIHQEHLVLSGAKGPAAIEELHTEVLLYLCKSGIELPVSFVHFMKGRIDYL